MDTSNTALILIGYQNDYFAQDGILRGVIEASCEEVLKNTLELIEQLRSSEMPIISTPINFTPDYSEVVDPVGILKTIVEVGAFKQGSRGAESIEEIRRFGDRITEVPGKRGLNAFMNTNLKETLQSKNITDVVLAGAVTSICIDSTGRAAFEEGLNVTILSDCTTGRSVTEQNFYCEQIFPLYASVTTHDGLLERLHAGV